MTLYRIQGPKFHKRGFTVGTNFNLFSLKSRSHDEVQIHHV